MNAQTFEHATVLVIGADTSFGRAVASHLAGLGARVVAHCTGTEHNVVGSELHVSADLLDEEALSAALEHVRDTFGALNVLVFCQGSPALGSLLEQPLSAFWQQLDEQLTASFLITRLATPLLKAASWGRVVLTCSGWSSGAHGLSAVATAGGGIQLLCKTLARELGPYGITVNALAHAFIDGPWLVCDARALGMSEQQLRDQAVSLVPAGRLGTPKQFAASAALLCHPEIGAAVGQTLQCSGGYFRRRT